MYICVCLLCLWLLYRLCSLFVAFFLVLLNRNVYVWVFIIFISEISNKTASNKNEIRQFGLRSDGGKSSISSIFRFKYLWYGKTSILIAVESTEKMWDLGVWLALACWRLKNMVCCCCCFEIWFGWCRFEIHFQRYLICFSGGSGCFRRALCFFGTSSE